VDVAELAGWETGEIKSDKPESERGVGGPGPAGARGLTSVSMTAVEATARGRRCRFFQLLGCTRKHAAHSCKLLRNRGQKKALQDSGLFLFRIRHVADAECFGKGTSAKPACKVRECKESHVESLHDIMTAEISTVNISEYGQDHKEEEEGFINMAGGEYIQEDNNGWRSPDDSWLDMHGESDGPTYHINVIIEDKDSEEELERGNFFLENAFGSDHDGWKEGRLIMMIYKLRKGKTTFGTIGVRCTCFPLRKGDCSNLRQRRRGGPV
jgi:hypothetical protein